MKSILKKNPSTYTYSNRVKLIRGGRDYFQLLESLIDQAKYSIYIQIYIFDEDETGRKIANALISASRRKVHVNILLDGYASKSLSSDFIEELKKAGIHFRWFTSFLKNKKIYLGRRLHHKVIVLDTIKSLVCGLNISDRYNDTAENVAWLDWAIYSEGEISADLEQICKRRMKDYSRRALNPISLILPVDKKDGCAVRTCVNDWVGRKSEITKSYLDMLTHASSHIIIMSPYFIPGLDFRRRLRQASQRGVRIQLILTGVSDIAMAKYAERYLYDWLLRYNIEIYEYQPNVLHGKIAVCDGQWSTVGSYNVNNLSAYASIELNLEVKNETFADQVEQTLTSIIETECHRITKKSYEHELTIIKRVLQSSAYNIVRMLFFLFTFKTRQQG